MNALIWRLERLGHFDLIDNDEAMAVMIKQTDVFNTWTVANEPGPEYSMYDQLVLAEEETKS